MPLDLSRVPAYATVHQTDVSLILDLGLPCPSIARRIPGVVMLQRADHIEEACTKRFEGIVHSRVGEFVHMTAARLSPIDLMIATGHDGVTFRRNRELVRVETTAELLARQGIAVSFIDHMPLSPRATVSRIAASLTIDGELLASRDFRCGRNSEFGAGLLIRGVLPPCAMAALICADENARRTVQEQVTASGLPIAVRTERGMYFWLQQQRLNAPDR